MSPAQASGVKHLAAPAASPPRLLDRVREAVRVRHYSIRTESAYVDWVRRFIHFHGRRHPQEMGAAEVTASLTALTVGLTPAQVRALLQQPSGTMCLVAALRAVRLFKSEASQS